MYGELERCPLILHRHYRIIKFWLKIIKSDARKISKICYNMMLRYLDLLLSKNNSAMCIRDLLNKSFSIVQQGPGVEQGLPTFFMTHTPRKCLINVRTS